MTDLTVGDVLGGPAPLERRELELLLEHVLNKNRAWLLAHSREPLAPEHEQQLAALTERVAAGEPLAYVLGTWSFYGLNVRVTTATLVPRPETEELVDRALALMPPDTSGRAVDLGTGSGAIALALARERPGWQIAATDQSAEAVEVARENARALGLGCIKFFIGDWWRAVGDRRFNLVVSNPPYVVPGDPRLTARGEPPLALYGGADGLDAYRAIVRGLGRHLETGGSFLVEHGLDQQREIAALVAQHFAQVEAVRDLAGHPRIIVATGFKP
ncbi:MAG: peptide chain release factor N(5)-glutamine methyltransferase [Pseudomonadota bacterium]